MSFLILYCLPRWRRSGRVHHVIRSCHGLTTLVSGSHGKDLNDRKCLFIILSLYSATLAISNFWLSEKRGLSATLAISNIWLSEKWGLSATFGYRKKMGTCSACDKIFVSRSARDRHRRTMHDTSSYTCPELRQEFFNGDGRTLMPLLMTLLKSVSVSNFGYRKKRGLSATLAISNFGYRKKKRGTISNFGYREKNGGLCALKVIIQLCAPVILCDIKNFL